MRSLCGWGQPPLHAQNPNALPRCRGGLALGVVASVNAGASRAFASNDDCPELEARVWKSRPRGALPLRYGSRPSANALQGTWLPLQMNPYALQRYHIAGRR